MTEQAENLGVDVAEHGEEAYAERVGSPQLNWAPAPSTSAGCSASGLFAVLLQALSLNVSATPLLN